MKRINKVIIAKLLIGLLSISIISTGCNEKDVEREETTKKENSQDIDKKDKEKRTFKDFLGNEVEVPKQVNKVAASFPALEEMFLLLGSPEKNVSAISSNKDNQWYNKLYSKIKDNPVVFNSNDSVNIESLVGLKPDVVFVGNEKLQEELKNAGIPSLFLKFTSSEELIKGIELIGEIMGEKESKRAKELAEVYRKNIDRVNSKTSTIPEKELPKVYYTANSPLNTEGDESIVSEWIRMGGGKNIAAENGIKGTFKDITMEQLLEWNPDIIICRDFKTKGEIENDSRFSSIEAVKNNKIFVNPRGVFPWCVRSADEALQPLWASTVIQPEMFKDIDMKKEVKEFYKKFYNYETTDEDLNDILEPQN